MTDLTPERIAKMVDASIRELSLPQAPSFPVEEPAPAHRSGNGKINAAEEVIQKEVAVFDRVTLINSLKTKLTIPKIAQLLVDVAENEDKPDTQLKAVQMILSLYQISNEGDVGKSLGITLPDGSKIRLEKS